MGVVEQGQGGVRGPQSLCLLFCPKHWCVPENHHLSQPILKRHHLQRGDCVLSLSALDMDRSGVVPLRRS